jgi:mono/diheme cytochrome c family protein
MQRALAALFALAGFFWLVASAADAPLDGAKLYDANCARCHGTDGSADTPVGKAMKARALKGPDFAEIDATTVTQVVRNNPKHKAVAEKVSDAELAAIAGHIRKLAGGSASSGAGAAN